MKRWLSAGIAATSLATSAPASALDGLLVGKADTKLESAAAHIVMMRDGTRTVVSTQRTYQGPPQDLAIVIPVPGVVVAGGFQTLPADLLARLDRLTAPRLVEVWEQDPCGAWPGSDDATPAGSAPRDPHGSAPTAAVVESHFAADEYEVTILGEKEAVDAAAWLEKEGYRLPEGSKPLLAEYAGEKWSFLVAKIRGGALSFKEGRATLPALRFAYDAETASLPLRLGVLNAPAGDGKQDVLIHLLSREDRFVAKDRGDAAVSTRLDVAESTRATFGPFYAALFDRTLEKRRSIVVTEYAGDARTCDPCPTAPLSAADLATLGGDALRKEPPPKQAPSARRFKGVLKVGSIDVPSLVHDKIDAMVPGFERCFEKAREDDPAISGSVSLELTLLPDGTPERVGATGGKGLPARLTSCLKARAALANMPPTPGRPVKLTIPLDLRSIPAPSPVSIDGTFVLTRLHARYDKTSLGSDPVFEKGRPVTGGGEGADGTGAEPAATNDFQARYVIRHPWVGAMDCGEPQRGRWGARPGTTTPGAISSAVDLAFVERGGVDLSRQLVSNVANLDLVGAGEPPSGSGAAHPDTATKEEPSPGCGGCAHRERSSRGGVAMIGGLVVAMWLRRRRGERERP